MGRDTCKMPGCERETRNKGDLEFPNNPDMTTSDGKRFRVSAFGARFCSREHELKYEHIRADAKDARMSEHQEESVEDRDLPERDGPPY